METKIKTTPKDFFLQLGAIIALYISAGSLIALLYQLINYAFPDALAYYGDPYSAGIRFAIASLIVIFPLYIFLGAILQKDFRTHPEKRDLTIRKILVYLTLFLASALIVGDLVALINIFLGGEITVRFILKVLVILVVAGLVFGYYMTDLKRPEQSQKNVRTFAWFTSLLVIVSIILGFFVMGSPITQRTLRFDAERVRDLQNIQGQIVNYWQSKGKIPEDLAALESLGIMGYSVPVDPKTEQPYEYNVLGDMKFELCATFELPTPDTKGAGGVQYSYSYPDVRDGDWEHGAGRKCFENTIDPDVFPVREKPTPAR